MKPLKFNALLKSTIWGGDKIIPFKHLDVKQENVGESWEISGVKGNETTVKDGEFAGKNLNEVVAELKDQLIGKENYKRFGNEFPAHQVHRRAPGPLHPGASHRRDSKEAGKGTRKDRDVVSDGL